MLNEISVISKHRVHLGIQITRQEKTKNHQKSIDYLESDDLKKMGTTGIPPKNRILKVKSEQKKNLIEKLPSPSFLSLDGFVCLLLHF